jgi:hypothetical protein
MAVLPPRRSACPCRRARRTGCGAGLQKQWIGHSSLKTTDRNSHTDQELEYRRNAARRVGLDLVLGPNWRRWIHAATKQNGERAIA